MAEHSCFKACGHDGPCEYRRAATPLWQLELRYLCNQTTPLWGSPMKRGELDAQLRGDPDLAMMLRVGYVEIVSGEGFVATKKGHEFVRLLDS